MERRSLFVFVYAILAVATSFLPHCDAFFFGRRQCRSDPTKERCGFFGWAVVQHNGVPGTDTCEQFCVYFESSDSDCGGCDDDGVDSGELPGAPIRSPVPVPTDISAPTPIPPSSPKPASVPVTTPAPFPFPIFMPVQAPSPIASPIADPATTPVSIPITPSVPVPVPVPLTVPVPVPVPVPVQAQAPVPTQSNYNIVLDFVGIDSNDRTFFTNANSRWESIVRGDLVNISTASFNTQPSPGCVYPSIVDDLYICSRFNTIDGPGRILGSAGPIYIRTANKLTITGDMQFDSEDISFLKAQGNFGSVILHEMGHILGIGTLWETKLVTGPDTANCPYNGPLANAEYKSITGCNVVPTENSGTIDDGTFCGHWDEDCMNSELMTGFLNGGLNPLSRITIATLGDLGYTVDYSTAESYGTSDVDSSCRCGLRSLSDSIQPSTVHQLGTSHKSSRRRSLSEEARQMAADYGQTILKNRQASKIFSFRDSFNQLGDDVEYVGDKVVVVFVEEGGAFFDVTVYPQV